MRFSQRTNWNTEESDLSRAHRERQQAGLPIADLTASNPTRCGFHYPAGLLSALTDPRALDYDPQPRGLLPSRIAVSAYYAHHGVQVDPDQIILTTSTSEAYSFLFRLLCDPGSEILVPQPGYPLFDYLATLDDVRLTPAPLVYDHGWQIEPEGFRRAITPATRAIMLVHPNNPTGHFTRVWEAQELAALCREHNLSLIVDEVFLDYPHLGPPGTLAASGAAAAATPLTSGSPAQLPDARIHSFASGFEDVPVFVVSGMSKIAGLPQMKAAWIVATGPERTAALDRLEVVADTFLSMNAPTQWALPRWFELRADLQLQIRNRVSRNLHALDRALEGQDLIRRLIVEGGWYAVLRIPALQLDDLTVLNLLEKGVWIHPGHFFGMPESGWLVASLLAPEPEFITGVTILLATLVTNQAR